MVTRPASRSLWSASRIGWGVVAVLALLVGIASLRFATFDPEMLDPFLRPNLVNHPLPFYLHTIAGSIALLTGVWQFMARTRRSAWHPWAGRVYMVAVAIAAPAGFIVAFTTEAGWAAGAGFVILAVLWAGTTLNGWRLARRRAFDRHRVWMIRSYALCAAAISLRLILPAGIAAGLSFQSAYIIAAWASWIINLAMAEWLIRSRAAPATILAAPR